MKIGSAIILMMAMLFGSATAAVVVVDNFTDGSTVLNIVDPPGPLSVSAVPVTGPGVLGTRDAMYTVTASPPSVSTVFINAPPYLGLGVQNADNVVSPTFTLKYSAFPTTALGNTVRLTDFTSDAVPLNVRADVTTLSGALTSGWVPVVSHLGDLDLILTGAGDWHNVTGLTLTFEGGKGSDFRLGSVLGVPEPAEYTVVAALGLTIFVMRRRRMSS
jgi:hypothetical protein